MLWRTCHLCDVKKSSGETAPSHCFRELSPRAAAPLSLILAGKGRQLGRESLPGLHVRRPLSKNKQEPVTGGTRANSFCPRTFSWSQWGHEVITVHSLRAKAHSPLVWDVSEEEAGAWRESGRDCSGCFPGLGSILSPSPGSGLSHSLVVQPVTFCEHPSMKSPFSLMVL